MSGAIWTHRIHREYTTSVEEVMRGLHKLVMNDQILYPAISDTPAWVCVRRASFRHRLS